MGSRPARTREPRPAPLSPGSADAKASLDEYFRTVWTEANIEAASRYVFFPWRGTIVRLPDADLFWRLRTARNRYLIDEGEQRKWSAALIGIAGLSVGASVLAASSLTGAPAFSTGRKGHPRPNESQPARGLGLRLSESQTDVGHAPHTGGRSLQRLRGIPSRLCRPRLLMPSLAQVIQNASLSWSRKWIDLDLKSGHSLQGASGTRGRS